MSQRSRPAGFWGICAFLVISLVFLLLGQTSAIFAYDFAVGLGLQESLADVSPYGVQVNRAFGVGDTVVYVPLIGLALAGLLLRRRWTLPVLGAVMGISVYWAATILAMLLFLPGTPGFRLEPGAGYWIVLTAYIAIGVWGLVYLGTRGDRLVSDKSIIAKGADS